VNLTSTEVAPKEFIPRRGTPNKINSDNNFVRISHRKKVDRYLYARQWIAAMFQCDRRAIYSKTLRDENEIRGFRTVIAVSIGHESSAHTHSCLNAREHRYTALGPRPTVQPDRDTVHAGDA
jgi:hypothetical protein